MDLVASHWSANIVVVAVVALTVVAHVAGVSAQRRAERRGGSPAGGVVTQAVMFELGLLIVVLTLLSPLAYWSHYFIWVRSIQAILLAAVAAPLMVLGAPWLALRTAVAPLWPAAGRWTPSPREAAPPRLLSWPVAVTLAFSVLWCGWYVPALYDAAARHPLVAALQIVSYLAVGVTFWLQLIGSRPFSPRLPPLHRVMLIAATVLTSTILAMVLGFSANVIYPFYAVVGHHHLLTVVADQQLGGAELWVLVLPTYVTAGVALLLQWLNDEERDALNTGLDRMLRPAKSAWPSRTGLR
jgi:cytochrome c oxidase assembly factor CtaG